MENSKFVTSGNAAWLVVVIFVILAILFGGCSSVVSESPAMIVTEAKNSVVHKYEYEYEITDSESYWILYSDEKYGIGDTIYISNKKCN